MFPQIEIERDGDVPVYRQIIERIATLVRAGELKPGDRVPPARELSAHLGIARGTITKAYEELSRSGMLELTQGRGSFVSARQDVVPAGRRERAAELVRGLVRELSELRFTYREIRSMVDLMVLDLEERLEHLHVVVVDCSPEALRLFSRQLGFVARMGIKTVLLGELVNAARPQERLNGFDLVLTTATHHADVAALVPELKDRLLQLVVTPSQETIISLAGIKPQQSIGVLCQSSQFRAIIKGKLDALLITNRVADLTYPQEADRLDAFVSGQDILIVPPDFTATLDGVAAPVIAEFTEHGGKIIPFDYQIERGSLVYLEERIRGLLEP
ncbi:MAG: GntR family transcriptional regulator [Pirellulaceae bacterium]|nr:GntR family transcriptional regulator [Pirellulaceae bacterium]